MQLPGFSKRITTAEATPRSLSGRVAVPTRETIIGRQALGKYEIVQLIGEGSNGEVYLARLVGSPQEYVVVKRVKSQLMQNPRFRQFFDSEVRSMTRFYHPYVVRLLEASLDDPIGPCLVMEYIRGVTLEAVLNHYGKLKIDHVIRILGLFCHALQAAHDAGIMHRDIKPANVMLTDIGTSQESLKVMDFGFAGFTEKPHVQLAEITGNGPVFACGTPAYVSPEMVRGDAVDERADLYSLGVIAFELITGRLPFDYHNVEEILAAHVKESPPRFASVGVTDIPSAIESVIKIVLAKYPNERMQSAHDLAEALGRAAGVDLWNETAPAGFVPPPVSQPKADEGDPLLLTVAPSESTERFVVYDQFEALLPPRMAAAKLRGFVEDVGGSVIESEPGVIKMQIAVPEGYQHQPESRSALFNWLSTIRRRTVPEGEEPIEVNMQMHKLDPNRVAVAVSFQPMREFPPADLRQWKDRCEQLNGILRMYLMAST